VAEGLTAAIAAVVRARMKREEICIVVCKSLEYVLYRIMLLDVDVAVVVWRRNGGFLYTLCSGILVRLVGRRSE